LRRRWRLKAAEHPAERSVRVCPPQGLVIFIFAIITGQNVVFSACAFVQFSFKG
jgi:hypothetical protein